MGRCSLGVVVSKEERLTYTTLKYIRRNIKKSERYGKEVGERQKRGVKWNGVGLCRLLCRSSGCNDICSISSKEPVSYVKDLCRSGGGGGGSSCHPQNARQLVGTAWLMG
ncbi:hypothetical protein OUZ56_022786 [Daphnia magna]|uniref:Uncharacterized protein n=1 Tax=Daphnia magna TaxID=35525 RepID=A0ABR0AXG1_9CRUS|nr:hypothetical protein OUZ56_022786 [Daphnia magna]